MKRVMRLRGVSGAIKGQVWDAADQLRVGRLAPFELILDDPSVSRKHAEVAWGGDGWVVRDQDSTNGTYRNGTRLVPGDHALSARDIVQFGKVAFLVEITEVPFEGAASDQLVMAASHKATFGDGIQGLVFGRDQMPRAGQE